MSPAGQAVSAPSPGTATAVPHMERGADGRLRIPAHGDMRVPVELFLAEDQVPAPENLAKLRAMASVPGIDSGFAFVPRYVGPRIVSTAKGERQSDGTLLIEIESNPAEGESYLPTRTTLRGTRVVSD